MLLFVSVFITACTGSKTEVEKTHITIAINQWPGFATAFIAQEKGFFKKNNVSVELVFDIADADSAKKYKHRDVEGIFNVFTDSIFNYAEGLMTKVVYITDYSDSGDVIIGKKEFNSLKDLKGKKIGVDGINSFSHLFVLASLEKAGLSENEVQFESVSAQQVLEALDIGRIDAGHTWEPTKSAALAKGYKQLGKAGDIPGIITDVLVFNNDIVKERPEEIKAIVKSMMEAKEFLDKNPEEAIRIMAEKEEMTVEEMALGLKGIHQPSIEEMLLAMAPGGYLYTSGGYISNFYIERGQISMKPDLGKIVTPEFIEQIK